MKHLKKFNENLENKQEIIDYIKLCFVEFYDNDSEIFDEEFNDGESITFEVVIDEPELGDYGKDFSEFIKHSQKVAEFYLEVENCIEKVKIRYNDINLKFEYQWPPEGYVRIIFILEGTGDIKEDDIDDINWIN